MSRTWTDFWGGIKTVSDVGMLIHINATPPFVISMLSSSKKPNKYITRRSSKEDNNTRVL